MMRSAALNAVVVGAGSAGLASAAELRRIGAHVTVLEDSNRPGDSWAKRYCSLRLNTLRALSGLPGLPIDQKHGDWVSGAAFADYLYDYAKYHHLQVCTSTKALAVGRMSDGRWQIETKAERLRADVVVIATGNAATPIVPAWAKSFTGSKSHTSAYRTPGDVSSSSVLVVGSGNSATEIATELTAHVDQVWMSVRTTPLLVKSMQMGISTHRLSVLGARLPDWMWDTSSLASHWLLYHQLASLGLGQPALGSNSKFRTTGTAPVAERGFAAAVRAKRIVIVPEAIGASETVMHFADGSKLRPGTLMLGTGFRSSYPSLLAGLPVFDRSGRPLAWGGSLQGFEGLFMVGNSSLQGDLREHGREAIRMGRAVIAMTERLTGRRR